MRTRPLKFAQHVIIVRWHVTPTYVKGLCVRSMASRARVPHDPAVNTGARSFSLSYGMQISDMSEGQ